MYPSINWSRTRQEMEIEQTKKQESHGADEKWVYDSSADHKGRIPLRASTGAWKASLFIIGKKFHEPDKI